MSELIHFKRFKDKRGCLVPIEGERDVPFAIKRRWIIKGVPEGETRGGHAHGNAQQVIIAVEGAFQVRVSKPERKTWNDVVSKGQPSTSQFSCYTLDREDFGLYIEPGEWVLLFDFSPGAICEVFSDCYYDEEDYVE